MNGSACKDMLSLEQNESVDLEGRVSNATGGCCLRQPSELCIKCPLCGPERPHKCKTNQGYILKTMVS